MKVALIGAGNNGAGHVRRLSALDDVRVVGIADPDADRAGALAAEVGGTAFDDHRRMLDDAKPDAVWVSSPCWLHAGHTVDAAQAGAHVMCEKPMALSLADCDRMIAAAREHGVQINIGLSLRYSPALLALQRILRSGRCGDLVNAWSIRQSYHRVRPGSEWRLDGERSGGIVFEWEVHEIDFVCAFGGPVREVYARTAHSRAEAPTFLDHFSAVLTFAGGGYANLEASQSCTLGMSGRGFVGTNGAARAEGRDTVVVQTPDMDGPETVTPEPVPRSLDEDFLRALRDGRRAPIPGEDGRANVEIGLAIVASGQTGQVVRLPLE